MRAIAFLLLLAGPALAEPMCEVTTGTPLAPVREMVPCSAVEQSCYAYALGAPVRCSWHRKPPRVRTEIIRP
jgi:hypothetical protein